MIISIIVAMAANGVIGRANTLPWDMPSDLKHFRGITTGHPVIMGSKTHESIGKALPGRTNIVLSEQADYRAEGCIVVHSIEEALALVKDAADEVFFIGGANVFRQVMPLTDRLYVTLIHHEFEGDVFFPEIDPMVWLEVNREDHRADESNPYAFSFLVFECRVPRSPR